jgi:hypothetical protein
MMWMLDFPKVMAGAEPEAYEDLATWEDVCEKARDELRTSIQDMGSDGYDLDWGREYTEEWFEGLTEGEQYEETDKAHRRGIDKQVYVLFPGIEAKLSTIGEARLPDGTWIRVREQKED